MPKKFETKQGLTIFVGRNAKENEDLTFKIANKDDLWFHIDEGTGSHVILVTDGRPDSELSPSIQCAADIASYYSCKKKEPNTRCVSVIYGYIIDVTKPKYASKGTVDINKYKTIIGYPHRINTISQTG